MLARRSLLSVALAISFGAPASVSAQDDWAITRDEVESERARPKRAAPRTSDDGRGGSRADSPPDRLLRALLAHPEDDLRFEQLEAAELAQRGSLLELEARLRLEQAARPGAAAPSMALARVLFAQGRWSEARDALASAVASGPDRASALLLRARLARSRGLLPAAREDFHAVLSLSPRAAAAQRGLAHEALAELALDAGELEQARAHFSELASEQPRTRRADELARALTKRGRHAEAALEYGRLIAARAAGGERLSSLYLELARAELAAGHAEAAVSAVEQARTRGARTFAAELAALELEARRHAGTLPELAERLEREAKAGRAAASREAAAVWRQLGQPTRAIASLRRWLARSPSDSAAHAELALLLERSGDFAAAERAYRELHRRFPEDASYVVNLVELLDTAGRRSEALALLASAGARRPRATALHTKMRELYLRWGEHALAERELQRLIALEPDNQAHVIAEGERALAAGDKAAALAAFRKLRSGVREEGAAEEMLARVLSEHDLLAEAIQHARRAAELARDGRSAATGARANSEPQRLLAALLERAGRDGEAESAWREVLQRPDADAEARREARQHLAVLLRRTGKLAQRTSELEQVLRESPSDLEAMRLLAELYARDPDQAQAEVDLLARLVAAAPADREALIALQQAQLRGGDVSGALRTSRRQLELAPGNEVELMRALDLARQHPRDDESRRIAERALERSPHSAEVHRRVGELFALRQDSARARAAYLRAVELDAREFAARHALAEDALQRGDVAFARVQLRAIIVGSADDELVASALEWLFESETRPGEEREFLREFASNAPGRPLLRRFWLERGLASLLPLARRAARGQATEQERAQLRAAVAGSSTLLLDALDDDVDAQRAIALVLFEAAPHPAALHRLLAIAERPERTVQERARALIAVAALQSPAATLRLRAMLRRESRHVRPFALWALAQSAGPAALGDLRDALTRDEDSVVVAALTLGRMGDRPAATRLAPLLDDPRVAVAAAALWTLATLDRPRVQQRLASALVAPRPLAFVALSAVTNEQRPLAEALLSPVPEHRRDAVALLRPRADESAQQLAPGWPFDASQYVRSVARAAALPGVQPSAETLAQVALERWQSAKSPATELELLTPQAGGLVPRAFLEASWCGRPALAVELANRLRESLATLAQHGSLETRLRALELLVRSGGAGHVAVQRALASGDREEQHAVLDALAELPAGSPLRPQLSASVARILASSAEWPTRMRAARALRSGPTSAQLAQEPVALVRAAPREPAVVQQCAEAANGASN